MVLISVSCCFIINAFALLSSLRYSFSLLIELMKEECSSVGASVVSASLFNELISVENACVRGLNSSTSSFLKDSSSFFILKASIQVLFFGMEKHTLFETESLSIRCCYVFFKFWREMFSPRDSCTNLRTYLYQTSIFAVLKFL